MSKKDFLPALKAQHILERLEYARMLLRIHAMMPDSENVKTKARIVRKARKMGYRLV